MNNISLIKDYLCGKNLHEPVLLNGNDLKINELASAARKRRPVVLTSEARLSVEECAATLKAMVEDQRPMYGVNTGFGILASRKISPDSLNNLSRNLVLSHSVGVGDPLPDDLVRGGILIRANTLAKGLSGVRPIVIDTLLALLENNILPVIPSYGSLGSSGDLAPLAHLAQTISAHPTALKPEFSGKARLAGKVVDGNTALSMSGIEPLSLGPKEGLALINGAAFSAAGLALCVVDAVTIIDAAEKAAVLSFEALQGNSTALDSRIHAARQHPGQIAVAERMRKFLRGSTFTDSTDRVQDPYSLRCIPQVFGPVHEILAFVIDMIHREMNAATDNPLIFTDGAVSGGNFHGEPISLASDYLKTALTEIGALSERRIYRLLSCEDQTGLPMMLIPDPKNSGLQSGLMLLQYTAASLTLDNQTLATPDAIRSLPTSAGQEDHNANSFNAVKNLRTILENLKNIIAIEFITASTALGIRSQQMPYLHPGPFADSLHQLIQSRMIQSMDDIPWSDTISAAADLIQTGEVSLCSSSLNEV